MHRFAHLPPCRLLAAALALMFALVLATLPARADDVSDIVGGAVAQADLSVSDTITMFSTEMASTGETTDVSTAPAALAASLLTALLAPNQATVLSASTALIAATGTSVVDAMTGVPDALGNYMTVEKDELTVRNPRFIATGDE